MIVVADASPLRYLVLIEHSHILPVLYGRVLVPPTVIAELSKEQTPVVVQHWITRPPAGFRFKARPAISFQLMSVSTPENARRSRWRWSFRPTRCSWMNETVVAKPNVSASPSWEHCACSPTPQRTAWRIYPQPSTD